MKKPEHNSPGFEVNKTVRLGTDKAPARVSVQSEERKQELITIFEENGWASIIDVIPDQEENLRDLEILQSKSETATTTKLASRNDPCPCGSGKKYKKCCGA